LTASGVGERLREFGSTALKVDSASVRAVDAREFDPLASFGANLTAGAIVDVLGNGAIAPNEAAVVQPRTAAADERWLLRRRVGFRRHYSL
jgi:hypothetical protein